MPGSTSNERNLKGQQQQLCRKEKGSNNRNKARKKVARVHRKIANCREDFLHKRSLRIVDEKQVGTLHATSLNFENLNIKGMMQNHCLAKIIGQVLDTIKTKFTDFKLKIEV